MKLEDLKNLREKKAFEIASEEEFGRVLTVLESIRPEASEEILKRIGSQSAEESLKQALVPVGQPPMPRPFSLKAGLWVSLVSAAAAVGAIGLSAYLSRPNPAPAKKAEAGSPVFHPLSRAELNQRISRAIVTTQNSRVIYEDLLGEGTGAWDPSPRYPHGIVNCILWVDQVLSEAYGAELPDKTPIMDKIRYYRGEVAFGLRKHFLPHRLEIEPEPLKALELSHFTDHVSRMKVTLDFDHFAEVHQYTCPFYRRDQRTFVLNYLKPEITLEVAHELPEGYYFLFAVPSDHYQKLYGAKSGPLGLVHGLILEVARDEYWIHHASTAAKRVMRQPMDEYITEMRKKLHKGYVIYEADPSWNFTRPSASDREIASIQDCEKSLYDMGSRRSAGLR